MGSVEYFEKTSTELAMQHVPKGYIGRLLFGPGFITMVYGYSSTITLFYTVERTDRAL